MPKRTRSIVVSLAGWLIIVGANHPPKPAQPKAFSGQGDTPLLKAPLSTQTPQSSYRPYAHRFSDACYNAKDHDAADLCAQWRAALAAEKAASESRLATIAAFVGIALSFATLAGLIVTIWQTRGALKEARRGNRLNLIFERRARRENREAAVDQTTALMIAQGQLDLARDTARIQTRPYVYFVEKDEYDSGFVRDEVFSAELKNFGLTPARNVLVKVGRHMCKRPIGNTRVRTR